MKLPIVVILGMHRSGTSLVANFMHAVGVEFGQNLMPADEQNAEGYWESQELFDTHEKIFDELNCDWHNPPLFFPDNWWRSPNIQQIKSDLVQFVRSEREKTDKIWGFKDPRTAILLPLWQEIFDELQLEPLYILSVRHPGPVAASLSKRDGLSASHSQALWLRTYLAALSNTRNHLSAVVDYDRWFESGLEQARAVIDSLNLSPSISEARIAEAVDRVIFARLRHHVSKQDAIYSPTVAKFYSLLRQAAIDGKTSDEIWTITETFEKAGDLLSIWDALVIEGNETIANNKNLLKKQKKCLRCSYAIIIVFLVLFIIYAFTLGGAHNWFK